MYPVLITKFDNCLSYAVKRITGKDIVSLLSGHRGLYNEFKERILDGYDRLLPSNFEGIIAVTSFAPTNYWAPLSIDSRGAVQWEREKDSETHFVVYEGNCVTDLHLDTYKSVLRSRDFKEFMDIVSGHKENDIRFIHLSHINDVLIHTAREILGPNERFTER